MDEPRIEKETIVSRFLEETGRLDSGLIVGKLCTYTRIRYTSKLTLPVDMFPSLLEAPPTADSIIGKELLPSSSKYFSPLAWYLEFVLTFQALFGHASPLRDLEQTRDLNQVHQMLFDKNSLHSLKNSLTAHGHTSSLVDCRLFFYFIFSSRRFFLQFFKRC